MSAANSKHRCFEGRRKGFISVSGSANVTTFDTTSQHTIELSSMILRGPTSVTSEKAGTNVGVLLNVTNKA